MRLPLVALCLLLAWPALAPAQSPDQKKLDVMVGRWKVDITLKATPLGPASTATGMEECEKFATHVVCRTDAGTYRQMRVLSYVPARKRYSAYTIDSLNSALLGTGQVSGDTWTFATDQPGFNLKLTLKIGANTYTALAEFAGPDGRFQPFSEVKGTRVR